MASSADEPRLEPVVCSGKNANCSSSFKAGQLVKRIVVSRMENDASSRTHGRQLFHNSRVFIICGQNYAWSIQAKFTSVLANSYSEKSPALAAAALLRMEGLDFSSLFSSPAAESLAKDNIMVFTL